MGADRQMAHLLSEQTCRIDRDPRQRIQQRDALLLRPLQHQRSSNSSPVAPYSASPNGSCLASSSTGE